MLDLFVLLFMSINIKSQPSGETKFIQFGILVVMMLPGDKTCLNKKVQKFVHIKIITAHY